MIIQKLDILKESNIIDQENYDYIIRVIESLKKHGIEVGAESPAETFLTHLAMAAARQKNAEPPIERLDAMIIEDIETDPRFARAQEIWRALEGLAPMPFGEEELDYFYLHICNMIQ